MTDTEKIQYLINQAQNLLNMRVTDSDQSFYYWRLETEDFLKRKFGSDSEEYKKLHGRWFSHAVIFAGRSKYDSKVEGCADGLKDTITELKFYLRKEEENEQERVSQTKTTKEAYTNNKVFLVHGHDSTLKLEAARLLEKLGIETVILSEQANQGRTIIEKFERYSDVGVAIILLTADDLGREKNDPNEKTRARQNVIFEAGYFMGKLGRNKVIVISEQNIEMPSDLHGVLYTNKDDWKLATCKELKSMGYPVDLNKLI